jgi:Icc-related predicted phosphoesterase
MKIQILSDIHNEFGRFEYDFAGIDLLILAGDIDVGEKGLDWIASNLKDIPVLYVLGNHEYYKHAYPSLLNKLRAKSKNSNIHILEKEAIVIDHITFHGVSLWTNFELFGDPRLAGYECEQKMNDYRLIRLDPSYSKLRAIDTHLMFYDSLNWLKNSLANSTTETNIVITHHAPSMKSVAERYQNDIVSAAFASNLDDFILEHKPNIWIHGQTRVVCNPQGYPNEAEHGYKAKFVIEI